MSPLVGILPLMAPTNPTTAWEFHDRFGTEEACEEFHLHARPRVAGVLTFLGP